MIRAEPISLLNTGVPLAALGALAVLVPMLLVPGRVRSQVEVALGVWGAAGIVLLAGVAVFAGVYAAQGVGVGAAFGEAPLATGWFFLKLSGKAAVLWGPVLALAWLGLAMRVEKRKGEDRVRR